MIEEQLLLFEEPLEGKLLRECKEMKASLDRVRKGQFAKIGALGKRADDHESRIDIIERNICHMISKQSYDELMSKYGELQSEIDEMKRFMYYLSQTVPRELELAYH